MQISGGRKWRVEGGRDDKGVAQDSSLGWCHCSIPNGDGSYVNLFTLNSCNCVFKKSVLLNVNIKVKSKGRTEW